MATHSTQPTDTHHWDVEIDMTRRSHGAIGFARWLRERSIAPEELRGVYVGSESTMQRVHPGTGCAAERVKALLWGSARGVDGTSAFGSFEVVTANAPERELCRLAEQDRIEGLIVGRAAGLESWSLLSLGRVTRRLLRRLPCPVVVVPPDLDVDRLGDGPIIVAVVPNQTSVRAARFATELGARLQLEVVLLHTVEPIEGGGDPTLTGVLDLSDRVQSAKRALANWTQAYGQADLPRRVEIGERGVGLTKAADRLGATMLVCGSRHLSFAARIFQSSTGSQLASHAKCPVAVVPSTPRSVEIKETLSRRVG